MSREYPGESRLCGAEEVPRGGGGEGVGECGGGRGGWLRRKINILLQSVSHNKPATTWKTKRFGIQK